MTSDKPTMIPAAYPELERETYQSLDFVTERPTLIPCAGEIDDLVAECRAVTGRRA